MATVRKEELAEQAGFSPGRIIEFPSKKDISHKLENDPLQAILSRTPRSLRESLMRTIREQALKMVKDIEEELVDIDRVGRVDRLVQIPNFNRTKI